MSPTVTLIGFALVATWFVIGATVSVRQQVQAAEANRKIIGVGKGVLAVVPVDVYLRVVAPS